MTIIGIYLLSGFAVFLSILSWAVIIDIILSWLPLLGIQIIIGPLVAITQPLYEYVRKIFPTQLGSFDFAPIVIIIGIDILQNMLIPFFIKLLQS